MDTQEIEIIEATMETLIDKMRERGGHMVENHIDKNQGIAADTQEVYIEMKKATMETLIGKMRRGEPMNQEAGIEIRGMALMETLEHTKRNRCRVT